MSLARTNLTIEQQGTCGKVKGVPELPEFRNNTMSAQQDVYEITRLS